MMFTFRKLPPYQEQEIREWAKHNYTPGSPIGQDWHPIAQMECAKINLDKLVVADNTEQLH